MPSENLYQHLNVGPDGGLHPESGPTVAAAVDLGSNMLRLAIGALDSQGFMAIQRKDVVVTRVAEGIEATGTLGSGPVERTRRAVAGFAARIAEAGAARVAGVATGAFRLAENREDVRAALEAVLGGPLEVIAGEREGALARRGIRAAHRLDPAARIGVLDIGGTSTELVVEGDDGAPAAVSIPTGVVNLTERAGAADLDERAREAVAALPDRVPAARDWFTAGGAAVALAAFERGESLPDFAGDAAVSTRADLARIHAAFTAATLEERVARLGVTEAHAGLVPAGYALLSAVLDRYGIDAVRPTGRGVVEGRLDELLRRRSATETDSGR